MTTKNFARLALCGMVVLGACGNDDAAPSDPLGVSRIAPAIDAVRQELGVEPFFFEINSTADGVNLFIATTATGSSSDGPPNAVIQGRFTDEDGLVLADERLEASGAVFGAGDVEVDPTRILDRIRAELPSSTPLMFVLTAGASDGSSAVVPVVRRVIIESERGGRFAVFVDDAGGIIGTDVLPGDAFVPEE